MITIPKFNQGHIALLCTAVLFGLAFIFQRHSAQYVSPLWFTAWRFLLATLTLTVIWALLHGIKPSPHYGRWAFYGSVSGVFMFGGMYAQQWGLAHTTAGKSGFLTGLYVVLVPILLWLFGYKPSRYTFIAVVIACLGLLCFAGISSSDELLVWNIGDWITLIGTVFWSLQVIWMGVAVRHANALAFSVMQLLTVSTLAVIGVGMTEGVEALFSWQYLRITKWDIAYTGIGSSALAFFLQAVGQRKVGASPAAIILSLEAVFALLFGWWLLEEEVTGLMLIGCGLMFSAIIVAQFEPPLNVAKLDVPSA